MPSKLCFEVHHLPDAFPSGEACHLCVAKLLCDVGLEPTEFLLMRHGVSQEAAKCIKTVRKRIVTHGTQCKPKDVPTSRTLKRLRDVP